MTASRSIYAIAIVCCAFNNLFAVQTDPVVFDVPAAVQAIELPVESAPLGSDKIIQITIPVSAQIVKSDRSNVDEFRYDIFWNRSVYPLVDYGPRTVTASKIDGNISVEKRTEKNTSFGLNLSGGYQDYGKAAANADLGKRDSQTLKYQEVPQFDLLVASGSIHRGTGAFFRFHPSKRETLEGGRDLVVAYRVPHSWRAGVLQVQCRANGTRKVFASWDEDIEVGKTFVVPIYLQGDDQARTIATEFVRSEQALRKNWTRHQARVLNSNPGFVGLFQAQKEHDLPADWAHYLIQSGTDDVYEKYSQRLPSTIRITAHEFVDVRRQLLLLSR